MDWVWPGMVLVFCAGLVIGFLMEVVTRRALWMYLDHHADNIRKEYEALARMKERDREG